jgi:hypothetical protein
MPGLPPAAPVKHLYVFLACLFIFVSTMMTFVNAVDAGFVNWDDDIYVTDNPHVQQLTMENIRWMFSNTYFYSWIPLTLLSHAMDVALWGMNAKGHHLTNVLLHSFNTIWVFLAGILLFRLSNSSAGHTGERTTAVVLGSLIGAMLYAMHPLRIEPVVWVSGRKDLLCLFFLLPAFWSYLSWRSRRTILPLILTHVFFAGALLAKPVAAVFPLLPVLVDLWLMKKNGVIHIATAVVEGKIAMWFMGVGVGIITMLGAQGGTVNVLDDLSVIERVLFPAYAILFYVWKIFAPFDLSPIYPDVHRALMHLSPLAYVGVAHAIAVVITRQYVGLAIAFLGFVILLAPTFLGLSTGLQPLADRYTYLASLPLFFFLGGSVAWLWKKTTLSRGRLFQREFLFAILLVLCGINAYRSINHTSIWNNSIALWSQAMLYAPVTRQEFEDRRPYLKPDYLDAMLNLGTAFYAAHRKDEAMEQFRNVVALSPANADAHYNLGTLQYEQGSIDSAISSFRTAAGLEPSYAKAHYNLGILLAQQDSLDSALASLRAAARLGYVDAQRLLLQRATTW